VSGLVGIDVDGPGGEALLDSLSAGELPPTLAFATGRGFRLLYGLPEGASAPTRHHGGAGGKVSVLGEGSLTVMPPSHHPGGRQYRWQSGCSPLSMALAPAPDWVHRPRSAPAGETAAGGIIPEGERNNRLFKLACAMRRFGVTVAEIEGTLRLVNRRCRPALDAEELGAIARSAARYPPAG
jgi:putative DNA primase/helicase